MKSHVFALLGISVFLLLGCSYTPVVDLDALDEEVYDQDLAECRALADQADIAGETAKDGLIGGGIGAVGGAAIGAISGNAGFGSVTGAIVGVFSGVGTGVSHGRSRQHMIIDNCLRGRGYNVLG